MGEAAKGAPWPFWEGVASAFWLAIHAHNNNKKKIERKKKPGSRLCQNSFNGIKQQSAAVKTVVSVSICTGRCNVLTLAIRKRKFIWQKENELTRPSKPRPLLKDASSSNSTNPKPTQNIGPQETDNYRKYFKEIANLKMKEKTNDEFTNSVCECECVCACAPMCFVWCRGRLLDFGIVTTHGCTSYLHVTRQTKVWCEALTNATTQPPQATLKCIQTRSNV